MKYLVPVVIATLFSCSANTDKESKIKDSTQVDNIYTSTITVLANAAKETSPEIFASTSSLRKYASIKAGVVYTTSGKIGGNWMWDMEDEKSKDNEGLTLVAQDGKRLKRIYQGDAHIEWFGAVAGNKSFDNSSIIRKALIAGKTIIFESGKEYTIKKGVLLTRVNNLHIKLNNAIIRNINNDVKTLSFDHCNTVTVEGGSLTRPSLPKVQNNKDQHTLTFIGCRDIMVRNTHIKNSPEMGICIMSGIGVTMLNNTISHTLRDGIYSHYSLNVKYIGNKLSDIKDDALSIHDYGLDREKPEILQAGYKQAGRAIVTNNVISNAMQGFSSIGCADLTISNNIIRKTVNAGIAVFNSETLHPGSAARVKNIKITGNKLYNCGDNTLINGKVITNGGQLSSGHAAIYVAANGEDGSFATSSLRSSYIYITDNIVDKSGVNGVLCYNIDGLKFLNNKFINCHANAVNVPQYTGNICEIYNCTDIMVKNNNIIDNRNPPLHDSAYIIDNSTGTFTTGINKGWRSFNMKIERSPKLEVNSTD